MNLMEGSRMVSEESKINTVFILGAGASAQGGAPLMDNFLSVARTLYRTNRVGYASQHFQRVFDAQSRLQAVFAKANLDINNIEDVFAAFEMGALLETLPGFEDRDQITELLGSLIVVIVKTIGITHEYGCEARTLPDGRKIFTPPAPYGYFVKLLRELQTKADPLHHISIITFNYDVGCDCALSWAELKYNYHLHEDLRTEDAIPLLKLHGSMNWGYDSRELLSACNLEGFLRKYELEMTSAEGRPVWVFDIGSRLDGCDELAGKSTPARPFIVPPTWSKTSRYNDIRSVWCKAAKVLREADNIFVSGYSFAPSDSFFRFLYAIGSVGESLISRFWVFDIDDEGGTIDSRYRSLLGSGVVSKYKYFSSTFQDSIDILRDDFFGSKKAWGIREKR